ncbi:MAG: transcription elongation factor GreB [Bdellovibrionota bacterium]
MADQPNYITPKGLQKLKAELKDLIQIERPKIVTSVAWAASNGDRSENADYIYGKRRLREIDRRVGFLTKRIENAQVVNPLEEKGSKIVFGATVYLEDEDGEVKKYQIVGEDEIDTEAGRISWRSPIAVALLGKKLDDEVVIKRPVGNLIVTVNKIEFVEY